jgi:hypothetical protein
MTMTKNFIFLTLVVIGSILVSNCSRKKPRYEVDTCLTKEKQHMLLQSMVRYASKLPPEATHETKNNPEFNWYYDKAVAESNILFCSLSDQDSTYQILVARQARSLTPMQEGIALKIKFDKQNQFEYYEEVFRTWKMPADTLQKRGEFLFNQMVNGGDLMLYQSKFQKDRFIEFPDDRFTFDIEKRKWKDAELDSINFE